MGEVEVHYGLRNKEQDFSEEGLREVARAVLVPEGDELSPIQLLFRLESYENNRGLTEHTLYVDRMRGDDKRTKARVTDRNVRMDERGILLVQDGDRFRELGQFCYDFSHYSPEERF